MARNDEGWDCDPANPDGGRTCRRVEKDRKTKKAVATGTDITISADPETCEPIFSGGSQTFLDKDDKAITEIARKVTSQCKKKKGL